MSVVPIIKTIGIGLGVLFWNTILLIIGWAVARFGKIFLDFKKCQKNLEISIFMISIIKFSKYFFYLKTTKINPNLIKLRRKI